MMQSIRSSARGACALTLIFAASSYAQMASKPSDAPVGGSKVPTRQLGTPAATSTEVLGSLAAVRQLPNGNVLVNDQARRRVLLMDAQLNVIGVVADSTSNTASAYGARPGGLIAYRGDSTLFVDPASLSMLVIDPTGKIVRTIAAPRPQDVGFLAGGPMGNPGFDSQGRLIYRTVDFGFRGARPQPGQPFTPPTPPDSSALVRFDLATRKLDTVGYFKIPKANVSMTQDPNGGMRVSVTMNPLPVVDDWAVMSDGSVAFVRGRDYHVEYVGADGAKTVAEKIPYDWQRMTDDDKQRFLDSAKVAIERQRAALAASGGAAAAAQRGGVEQLMGAAAGGMTITMRGGDGPPRVEVGGGGPGGPAGGPPPVQMVNASELPDYKPVFGQGAVRADMQERLWVRTIPTKVLTGGAIYEVIDRSGKLVDRVQVPAGTTIAGFGKDGSVYLGMRDDKGLHLQRAVLK